MFKLRKIQLRSNTMLDKETSTLADYLHNLGDVLDDHPDFEGAGEHLYTAAKQLCIQAEELQKGVMNG